MTPSYPEAVEATAEVLVVGGGICGLTAAYHLRDREVMVLESGDCPGGVCQPGSYQGVLYPAGSAYFSSPWDSIWQAWYQELGLPLEEARLAAPFSALFHQGAWYPDCFSASQMRSLPLSPAAIAGLEHLAADLATWEETWDALGAEVLPQPELDRYSLTHYLEEVRGLSPEVTRLFTPYCRSCLGAGPDHVSAWAGIYFLMSEFSRELKPLAFPEGNARLIRALCQALPRPPRTRQTVVRLEPRPDRVQVIVWDDSHKRYYRLESGAVILAVGKFAARHLLPPDCGWDLHRFAAFRYSSYLVAALCGPISLQAPAYENWVVGEEALSDFVMSPREAPPGQPRVMLVFAPQPYPQGRQPLLSARPEAKGREIFEATIRLFPALAGEVEEIRLYRFGHAQVVPYPGFLTFLKHDFPKAHGPIILAHSDLEGLPCIEAAMVQGQKAARRARAVLGLPL